MANFNKCTVAGERVSKYDFMKKMKTFLLFVVTPSSLMQCVMLDCESSTDSNVGLLISGSSGSFASVMEGRCLALVEWGGVFCHPVLKFQPYQRRAETRLE